MNLQQIATLTKSLIRELRSSLFRVSVENWKDTQKVEVINPTEAQETVEVSNLIDVRPELKDIVKKIEEQVSKTDDTAQKKDIVKAIKDLKTKPVKDLTPEVIKKLDKSVKVLEKIAKAKPDYSEIVKALEKEDDKEEKDPLEKYARYDEIKTRFNEKQLKELKDALKVTVGTASGGSVIANQDGPITQANPLAVTADIEVSDIQIGAVELKDGSTDNRAVIDTNGDINAIIQSGLVPSRFDYIALTYVAAGNGAGEIETATFKTGGAGGTTVATLTLGYDGDNNLSTVTKT